MRNPRYPVAKSFRWTTSSHIRAAASKYDRITGGDAIHPGPPGQALMAYGILTLHAKELLHARVPGFDHAAEIDGQHTDVQGFDDIFAEVFEARDFQGLLLE